MFPSAYVVEDRTVFLQVRAGAMAAGEVCRPKQHLSPSHIPDRKVKACITVFIHPLTLGTPMGRRTRLAGGRS